MPERIAKPYAQALFDLCEESKKIEQVHEDLKKVSDFMQSSEEFEEFISNPVIPSEQRQSILKDIFKTRLDQTTFHYLLFLATKERLHLLPSICVLFEEIYHKAENILNVKITSSIELKKSQVQAISQHLKDKFKKTIQPQLNVIPEILGGLKIQIGDRIYDHSLLGKLQKFKKKLIHS